MIGRMPCPRWRNAALAAMVACTLAGCGSRIGLGTAGDGAAGQLQGPSVAIGTETAPAAGGSLGRQTNGELSPDQTSRNASTSPGTATTQNSSTPGSSTAGDGPGVTSSTIKLGIAYDPDSAQGNAAVGASGTDSGDVRTYYNALFQEINAAGGIAGRKLTASYFAASSSSNKTTEQVDQAACAQWTQDTRVFAVFSVADDLSRQCLGSKGVLALNTGASNSLRSTFKRFPYYVETSSIALDRSLSATADGLATTDYYGKAPTIGIISWDNASYRSAVQTSLIPALSVLGHRPVDPIFVRVPEAVSDLGGSSADVSSAVLKFRQEGVTHVFMVDGPAGVFGGTGLTLLFIKNAGSQHYYPRYGMNDSNSPQAGIDAGLWTANDVRGSRVVSSANILDSSDAGIAPNLARKQCLALMARHGIKPANVNQRGFILRSCEFVWFLKVVLRTEHTTVNRDVFMARVAQLGTGFASPTAYRTFFSAAQHDGVAGLRREALSDSCGCYTYIGGIYAAPQS